MEPTYTLEGLRGVGRVELTLRPEQRAYVFFGSNGVGKTKCLEALFQYYFFQHQVGRTDFKDSKNSIALVEKCLNNDQTFVWVKNIAHEFQCAYYPNSQPDGLPVVFLGAGKRGYIEEKPIQDELFGTFESRQKKYLNYLLQGMENDFSTLGMDMGLEQWIVTIAHYANPFQKSKDNRLIEIETLLQLLHQVDARFDKSYIEIDGDNHIFLKIDGLETDIRNLSTGFTSLLKIFQTIISGYGFFTNSTDLANVKGIVFIDEIESHLHVSWQSKIIPLLKELFPNTTFFIATHSPIVLSQLQEGEAYRLEKQADDVVRAIEIEAPNKRILSDVLVDAMDVDLNALKRNRLATEDQTEAKKGLLALLRASKAARQKEQA